MENKDVVYFSVNNWMRGVDYPPLKCFDEWLGDDLNQTFRNDAWCKENKLCVYYGCVDMSQNYTISAPREWVEKNCPELLTDEEFTYITRTGTYKKKSIFSKDVELVWEDVENKKKYSDFVYVPEIEGDTPDNDRVGEMPFREYKEENFGSEYYETYWWGDEDDDEDDEDSDEDDELDG